MNFKMNDEEWNKHNKVIEDAELRNENERLKEENKALKLKVYKNLKKEENYKVKRKESLAFAGAVITLGATLFFGKPVVDSMSNSNGQTSPASNVTITEQQEMPSGPIELHEGLEYSDVYNQEIYDQTGEQVLNDDIEVVNIMDENGKVTAHIYKKHDDEKTNKTK